MNYKSIRISVENPTIRQRFIVFSSNFLIWWACIIFSKNKKRLDKEVKEIITTAYKYI
jgi:hypothetical protein